MVGETVEQAEIVVVGAGPSGLTAALQLANRGHQVLILERWPKPYPLPRAVGFDWESCRIFQDLGIIDKMLEISQHGGDYRWVNARGETILLIDHTAIGPTGWPMVNNFSQPQLESVLRDAVAKQPLISMRSGVEVTGIDDGADGVIIRSRHQVGLGAVELGEELEPIFARFVVGADGANSLVREAIGTSHTDLGFFYDWLVIDVIPQPGAADHLPRGGLQVCDPVAPTTVVHGGPGRRRWEFLVMPGEDPAKINTDEEAWRRLVPWGLTPENSKLERRTIYRFQARWADNWNKGHLVIIGDAAHLMPPFAGQGMNSGLRDAVNAAWKLDLVLAGKSPIGILDSITAERGHHVRHAIHYSVELGKVICIVDAEAARARDERMLKTGGDPAVALPKLPDPTFVDGIVRRDANGTSLMPAGHVAPQFEIAVNGGQPRLFDDVFGRPAALISGVLLRDVLSRQSRALLDDLGYPVIDLADTASPVEDVSGGYAEELKRLGAAAGLIRPDGYYFGIATRAEEIDDLVQDFGTQLGLVERTAQLV